MATQNSLHNCENCALKKIYLDIDVDVDDAEVYMRIENMVDNGLQSTSENAIENIPKELATKENIAKFKINAKINLNNAYELRKEWWQLMKKKYEGVDDSTKFDMLCKKFFKCVDKNGVGQLTSGFFEKED